MLKRPVPGKKQWFAMVLLCAGLSTGLGYVAWAAQPAQGENADADAPYYSVKLQLDVDGETRGFEMRGQAGKPFAFSMDTAAGRRWEGEFSVQPLDAEKIVLTGILREGRKVIVAPRLVMLAGGKATMQARTQDGGSLFRMEAVVADLGTSPVVGVAAPVPKAHIGGVQTVDAPASTVGFANMSPPRYPPSLHTGEVVLKVDVAADGTAAVIVVDRSSGHADLDEAAVQAARGWRFNPARKDGRTVAGKVRIPVRFDRDQIPATIDGSAP